MTAASRQSPIVPLVRIAVLVALGDLLTKHAALVWIGALDPQQVSAVGLGVVHNDKGAFGLSAGAFTFEISLGLTLATIALIVPVARDLARIDGHAPAALGLIAGGATGNLVSLLLHPKGVVDFIALQRADGSGIVLNIADVAAYAGVALLMRTAVLVVAQMRRPVATASRPSDAVRSMLLARLADHEVARAVHSEVTAAANPVFAEGSPAEKPLGHGDRPVHLRVVHADGPPTRRTAGLSARLTHRSDETRSQSTYPRPMSHPPGRRGGR